MTKAEREDGAPWRNFYGRRHGRQLRAGQAALVARLSELAPPGIGWDENPERRPLDLARLYPGRAVWLEIGFGGGEHMLAQAAANPDVQIIGAEPFINGVAKLLAAIERTGVRNASVTSRDARDVMDVLPEGSVARVFLLYPDPWPKARHHRRRFVNPPQLAQLARVMAPGAELRLATDIEDYVRHTLEVVTRDRRFAWTAERPADWREPWKDWPGTRYEAKALREGRRPHYLTFLRTDVPPSEAGRAGPPHVRSRARAGRAPMSNASAMPLTARRGGALRGTAEIPGDKSVSHRALILGALTVGETRVTGLLEGDDVLATARAMRAFGADVTRTGEGAWSVHGLGVGGFAEPAEIIDCGNAGTGVRLIMGSMATSPIAATFTGDASLRRRPMGRVLDPLRLFGAESLGRAGGLLPLTLCGARDPVPVEYRLPVASAQVKSAVLLAALNAPGKTVVIEGEATRDHTERMLRGFGAILTVEDLAEGRAIRLTGQPELVPQTIAVPRDPSSAAFPVAAALLVPGSEVVLPNICLNPIRAGLYATLSEMGADIVHENPREEGGEPVADLRVRHSGLRGAEVPPERAPSMIDEYPILACLAAFAEGPTVLRGIGELRVKESDRIAATVAGLRANGVEVDEHEDGMTVHGRGGEVPGGGSVATHLDHRIAMSFLMLGLAANAPVTIDDGAPIATSFPGFLPLMRGLGAEIAG